MSTALKLGFSEQPVTPAAVASTVSTARVVSTARAASRVRAWRLGSIVEMEMGKGGMGMVGMVKKRGLQQVVIQQQRRKQGA